MSSDKNRKVLFNFMTIIGISGFPVPYEQAQAAPVVVEITNVPDTKGAIRVALCTQKEFLGQSCAVHGQIASHAGQVTVKFGDVPSGVYAVQTFQDRNDDGKLDKNFFGIPKEPVGFSRNPHLHFGPPAFEQCALTVTEQGGTIPVVLITHQ